jgi:acetyltransferase-like isoleucine patch superfamily enzyme
VRVGLLAGVRSRLLQVLALYAPGGNSVRVALHRLRGVTIGKGTWIGFDTLIEPMFPHRVSIGDRVSIGMRVLILAHAHQEPKLARGNDRISVRIEDDVFIGPGVIIVPNVTLGAGAVVAAGSVVTRSVAPLTMVQGNPAKPVARCGIPLGFDTSVKEFYRRLTPIEAADD